MKEILLKFLKNKGENKMGLTLDLNKAYEQAMNFYKKKNLEIHQDTKEPFPYIETSTNKNKIKYCAICFGYEGKLIPLFGGNTCLICQGRLKNGS